MRPTEVVKVNAVKQGRSIVAILIPIDANGPCDACGKEGFTRAYAVNMIDGRQGGQTCSLSCAAGYVETATPVGGGWYREEEETTR